MFIKNRKHSIDDHCFDFPLSEDAQYFAGWVYCDGFLQRNQVSFELQKRDIDLLYKFKHFTKTEAQIKSYRNGRTVYLSIGSPRIAKQFARLGISSYPSDVHPNLRESRDFFRGCLEADGSIYISSKGAPILKLYNNLELLSHFRNFCLKFTDSRASILKCRRTWCYTLTHRHCKKVLEVLYVGARYYLNRKAAVVSEIFKM